METNAKLKKPKDLEHINTADVDELLWWSVQFSICPEKLMGIIAETGNGVAAVKKKIATKQAQ